MTFHMGQICDTFVRQTCDWLALSLNPFTLSTGEECGGAAIPNQVVVNQELSVSELSLSRSLYEVCLSLSL